MKAAGRQHYAHDLAFLRCVSTSALGQPNGIHGGNDFVTAPESFDRETIDIQLKILQAYTDGKML